MLTHTTRGIYVRFIKKNKVEKNNTALIRALRKQENPTQLIQLFCKKKIALQKNIIY